MMVSAIKERTVIRSLLPTWKFYVSNFVVWTIFGLFIATLLYSFSVENRGLRETLGMYIRMGLYFEVWAMLTILIYLLITYLNEKNLYHFPFSILMHIPVAIFFAFLHNFIFVPMMWLIGDRYFRESGTVLQAISDSYTPGIILLSLLIYALMIISIQSVNFFRSYKNEEARNLQLSHDLTKAQLQALKMQLQPHFLFNTLHSIAALNLVDVEKANEMIAKLGDFLRMTLENSDTQMVSLAEELDFARHYLGIERIRFGDRLTIEINVEDELKSCEVPHLILQPIVENAIKHGISPFEGGGHVAISAINCGKVLSLEVVNSVSTMDNVGRQDIEAKGGRGLKNVRERLLQIYRTDFSCDLFVESGTGEHVTRLEIPLRTV